MHKFGIWPKYKDNFYKELKITSKDFDKISYKFS